MCQPPSQPDQPASQTSQPDGWPGVCLGAQKKASIVFLPAGLDTLRRGLLLPRQGNRASDVVIGEKKCAHAHTCPWACRFAMCVPSQAFSSGLPIASFYDGLAFHPLPQPKPTQMVHKKTEFYFFMFNFHTQASVNSWLCNFLSAVAVPSQCLAVSFVFAFGLLGKPSIWAEVMAPIVRSRRRNPFREAMAWLPAVAETIQRLAMYFAFAFGLLGKPSIWAEVMAPIGRCRRTGPFRDPMASLPARADTIQYLVVSFVFAFGFFGKPSIWAEIMAPIGRCRRQVHSAMYLRILSLW